MVRRSRLLICRPIRRCRNTPGKPYRAGIFSDGMCDGGPLELIIPR